MVKVNWTGQFPNLCRGEWSLEVDGEDYSELVPFNDDTWGAEEADTYGVYTRYDGDGNYKEYEDGMEENEWIAENKQWLSKITTETGVWLQIYKAFQEKDWRHSSCGGCV